MASPRVRLLQTKTMAVHGAAQEHRPCKVLLSQFRGMSCEKTPRRKKEDMMYIVKVLGEPVGPAGNRESPEPLCALSMLEKSILSIMGYIMSHIRTATGRDTWAY